MADYAPQIATNPNKGFDWGGLIGAGLGAGASIYGSNQVKSAADAATGVQQGATTQGLGNLAPYQAAGMSALGKLTSGNIDLNSLPGYTAGLEQGEQGINRGMAARGMYNSGAALKGLTKFNQDYANTQYGNEWNRLNSLSNTGLNATNNANALISGMGNAGAAGQIAKGNATNAGLTGAGMSLADYLTSVPKGSNTSVGSSLINSAGGLIGSGYNSLSDYLSSQFGNSNQQLNNSMGGSTSGSYVPEGDYTGVTGTGAGASTWNPYLNEWA